MVSRVRMVSRAALLLVLVGAAACTQDGLDAPSTAQALDAPFFRCRVQPVLVRDCGFLRCHGSAQRPFRLYAPNNLRDGVDARDRARALTPVETDANFASALAFAGTDGRAALLLLKPLDERVGGYYHRGATFYDRGDVFTAVDDPGYVTLATWIGGATDAADCTPVEP